MQERSKETIDKIILDYSTGKSIRQLSKKYNLDRYFIRKILFDNKVNVRQRIKLLHIPSIRKTKKLYDKHKDIVNDYENGISSYALCKKYNCSKGGILKVLKKNHIKMRPTKKMFDKLILQQQYINDKKSIREIVKETKSHEATVRRNLKEIGICPRKYNEQQIIDNDNGKRINLNKIKPGIEKDPRFFYLLGAFKGDGHYNIKYTKIQFSVTDLDFIEEVKHIFNVLSPETHMRILDGVEATKRTKKQWKINICSRDFFKKEYHKLLPKTLQEKRFYLKGLFDAEGSASEDGGSITICQKNLDDLRLWKEWLEELNIKTKQYISKEEERIYGHLRIFGRDSKINFYDAIGFKIKRKQDRLEQYIKKIKPYVQYDYEEGIDGLDGETDFVEVESICFSNKEQGIDISVDHPDHNVCSSDDIVFMQSTIAQQVGYFLAWLMSGGRMDRDEETGTWTIIKAPTKAVHFTVSENIVFTPEDLMKRARDLFVKYGKHQVIIYDEGRTGLDSASAMTAINKAMADFLQECGQYGHMILIVLPNYFKLHEDYAVNRSLFLIDVYANKELRRGFFDFYNETQKEWLYFMGKRKIGSSLKYYGSSPSFSGRFTQFIPVSRDEYDKAKADALKNKELKRTEKNWKRQRDAAFAILCSEREMTIEEIADKMTEYSGSRVTRDTIRHALLSLKSKLPKEVAEKLKEELEKARMKDNY